MLNRRRFVYGIVTLGILGPGSLGGANAAPRTGLRSLEGRLSKDVFLALRQHTFTALIDHRRVRLVLVEVSDVAGEGDGEQFTVLFRGPADRPLTEGAYIVSHPTAGTTALYVQPGGVHGRTRDYTAPFNLLS